MNRQKPAAWKKRLEQRLEQYRRETYISPPSDLPRQDRLTGSLAENMIALRRQFANSSDLLNRELTVCGLKVQLLACEGMVSLQSLSELLAEPLNALEGEMSSPQELLDWFRGQALLALDQKEVCGDYGRRPGYRRLLRPPGV